MLERVHAAYEWFKAGLSKLGVLQAKITRKVFCYSKVTLTAEAVSSVHGSNNRQIEGLVLSSWNNVLQDVEEKAVEITFSDILFLSVELGRFVCMV